MQESLPASSKATTGKPRVLKLTDQQKEDIESMASPSCMEPSERKRQYSAMRRAIAKSCEPALLAKFQLCNDGERCHSHVYLLCMYGTYYAILILFNNSSYNLYGPPICLAQLHRLSMLKQWMISDGSCDSITVEEKYSQWVEQLRSDKYVTVLGLQAEFSS